MTDNKEPNIRVALFTNVVRVPDYKNQSEDIHTRSLIEQLTAEGADRGLRVNAHHFDGYYIRDNRTLQDALDSVVQQEPTAILLDSTYQSQYSRHDEYNERGVSM